MAWNTLPYENNGYLSKSDMDRIKEVSHIWGDNILRDNQPERPVYGTAEKMTQTVNNWNQSTGVENPDHPKVTEYIDSLPVSQRCKDAMMSTWRGWGQTKFYVEQYGNRTVDELAEEFISFMNKPVPDIAKAFADLQAKVDTAREESNDGDWDPASVVIDI